MRRSRAECRFWQGKWPAASGLHRNKAFCWCLRASRHRAAAITHGKARGGHSTAQRMFVDGGRMGVACGLAPHGAQAESFGGIKAGGFHAAIVKRHDFGLAPFKKQFAVIRPMGRLAQQSKGSVAV